MQNALMAILCFTVKGYSTTENDRACVGNGWNLTVNNMR
uniref:Uncharacterized protein n=1 Tax=Rhizophora mucronata TaxID=61149 RepID=A0A2P2ITU9_RHIMU